MPFRIIEPMTINENAAALGFPAATVKARPHRANNEPTNLAADDLGRPDPTPLCKSGTVGLNARRAEPGREADRSPCAEHQTPDAASVVGQCLSQAEFDCGRPNSVDIRPTPADARS
jgi:hypothetical protein